MALIFWLYYGLCFSQMDLIGFEWQESILA